MSGLKKDKWQVNKWIQSTSFVEKIKSLIKWPVLYVVRYGIGAQWWLQLSELVGQEL